MKKIIGISFIALSIYWTACTDAKGNYVDLRTGERIKAEQDPKTGVWINTKTEKPVYILVDTRSNDTIYGISGEVINGHVVRADNNIYWYENDPQYKFKSGDYKVEREKDGDLTIKDGNKKIKIEGETGEQKIKYDN